MSIASLIQESDGSFSTTRTAFLVFLFVWSASVFLYGRDHIEALMAIGAAAFTGATMNNRYQERKETVVDTAKPTDNTQLKVDA